MNKQQIENKKNTLYIASATMALSTFAGSNCLGLVTTMVPAKRPEIVGGVLSCGSLTLCLAFSLVSLAVYKIDAVQKRTDSLLEAGLESDDPRITRLKDSTLEWEDLFRWSVLLCAGVMVLVLGFLASGVPIQ